MDPSSMRVLVICASPHESGTTALVSECILHGALGCGAKSVGVNFSSYHFEGCDHCGTCAREEHKCRLAGNDDCEVVFRAILDSDLVFWISPVYFYGLPSQSKALVDRSQRFWEARGEGGAGSTSPRRRTCLVPVFLAGRMEGEKLFEGSRLTMSTFGHVLGVEVWPPLCLRGLESPSSLSLAAAERISRWANEVISASGVAENGRLGALEGD